MRQPGLHHVYAGYLEPGIELGLERSSQLVRVLAETGSVLACSVVRVTSREAAQSRLGLDIHELLVVVDVERGFGRVLDPPHHHCADLDGVAVGVVDLERLAVEVAHPESHPSLDGEGVYPP